MVFRTVTRTVTYLDNNARTGRRQRTRITLIDYDSELRDSGKLVVSEGDAVDGRACGGGVSLDA